MSFSCGFAKDRRDDVRALKRYAEHIFSEYTLHEKNVSKIYFTLTNRMINQTAWTDERAKKDITREQFSRETQRNYC